MDISSILKNWTPGYVPPVSWEALARTAHRQGLKSQDSWPQPMRAAYQQTKKICIAAAAETSAYLVSRGEGGEL